MPTTLNEARTALHKLSGQFPAKSTYADQLAVLLDYFDNQVPLNIENRNLTQRITVLEATIAKVRDALPADVASIVGAPPAPNFIIAQGGHKDALRADLGGRRFAPIDCTAWMGAVAGACSCPSCRVRAHA
jgi:hypothetical protein